MGPYKNRETETRGPSGTLQKTKNVDPGVTLAILRKKRTAGPQ